MKHFLSPPLTIGSGIRPLTEQSLAPVTYDTMHSVTLSLSDWLNVQTYLSFYANNILDEERGGGEKYRATAEKVCRLVTRLADKTDSALDAAADTAEGE